MNEAQIGIGGMVGWALAQETQDILLWMFGVAFRNKPMFVFIR